MRLLTNHQSNVCLALRAAAERIGGEVRSVHEFACEDDLKCWDPLGALVFMYGWPKAAEETVKRLKDLGILVAVWQVDDPYFFSDPSLHDVTVGIARSADVYFSHTRQLDEEYALLGVRVHYLPTAAKLGPEVSELVLPPLRGEQCERDYAFVGTLSDSRRAFLEGLAKILPPEVVGEAFVQATPRRAFEIYRSSRITLSFGTASEGGANRSVGLTERTWDVPLVGGFLLQDERPYLAEHFVIGKEAATFSSVEECAEKIVHYLAHDDERRAIAARARSRVLRDHLMEKRLAIVAEHLRGLARGRARPLAQARSLEVRDRFEESRGWP